MHELDVLSHLDGYRKSFLDAGLWAPYLRVIARRHGLDPAEPVRVGLAGTCPTFIVGDCWVIKLFGELFDGEASFQTELAVNRLLAGTGEWPVPALLASGNLDPAGASWPWPYLVFAYLPFASYGEQSTRVHAQDKQDLAVELGRFCRRLHALPIPPGWLLPPPRHDYASYLVERRTQCAADLASWGSLPPHLLDELDEFLPPVEALLPPGVPSSLIHADLTRDHILGQEVGGHWKTRGIIDFGDARIGDIYTELNALHLDLFARDKRLLGAFLDAYGMDPWLAEDFARKAMAAALLFPFDALSSVPHARTAATLEELADFIWKL